MRRKRGPGLVIAVSLLFGLPPTQPLDFTEEEAEHVHQAFTPPAVEREFLFWIQHSGFQLPETFFIGEAQWLAQRFCESERWRSGGCTWREYQGVVTAVLRPFAKSYSHGHGQGMVHESQFRSWTGAKARERLPGSMPAGNDKCAELHRVPSSSEFLELVESSTPVIIRGAVKHWPALERWSTDYLRERCANVGGPTMRIYFRPPNPLETSHSDI